MIAYSPYAIFSNAIPIFDINFFSPNTSETGEIELGEGETEIEYVSESSAAILQPTIASWYVALRNIAIVGLMSVLLYIGIRIVIGSANDKAKYKERIIDWLVAICLLFVMHYIMVFIIEISQTISSIFAAKCTETILVPLPTDTKVDGETLVADENAGHPMWACNFIGYARLIAGGYSDYDTMTAVAYTIIYAVLVIDTIIFTIMYLKRVLYMAFLTMIAPLVALMYPIDKMNDGKAQGFDTWLKEYIFNALMQPFHLLLYTMLVGSVMGLAMEYPVYALVALGFLIPAEKMLRKMLGFEKAQTPSNMGTLGVAGAGLLMSGINRLAHRPRKNKEDGNNLKQGNEKVRMKSDDFDAIENFAGDNMPTPSLNDSQTFLNNDTQENFAEGNMTTLALEDKQAGVNGETQEGFNTGRGDTTTSDFTQGSQNIEGENAGITGSSVQAKMDMDTQNTVDAMVDQNDYLKGGSTYNTNKTGGRMINANTGKKRTLKNRLGNGIMAVGTRYNKRFTSSHPLRSLRRAVTFAGGAATLGMVGLAAGIASGDLGKTAQYTAAAGVVGGNLAKGLGDTIANETKGNAEAFRQGWHGEDYEDVERENAIIKAKTDPDNIQYLRERTPEYKEILKDAYPEYARYGCTDMEDFWAAYQLEQAGASRNSAISTYKLAQRVGDVSKSPDAENKWAKRLEEEFGQSTVVQERQKAEQERISNQYELDKKQAEKQFEEQSKKAKNSRSKDRKVEYEKVQKEREKKLEELRKIHENRQQTIRMMPSQLTKESLNSVKQFYKNK